MICNRCPRCIPICVLVLLLVGLVSPVEGAGEAPSAYDRVWGRTLLYSGSDDDFFQSFQLSGRLQLDFAWVDSGADDHGELNFRRTRFGFKTVFRRDFTLHLEGDFDPQSADPFFTRWTDAYLRWSRSEVFQLTAGKQSCGFTLDGMTSSKRLLTIDRSNLANNLWFPEEYFPGVSVDGEKGGRLYKVGVFFSGPRIRDDDWLDGGEFFLLTLGQDFASRLGADKALLRLNLVSNQNEPGDTFTRSLERIGSLNFLYDKGAWGLGADLASGEGNFGQSDLQGLLLMAWLRRSEKLELIGRYTHVESDLENGVRFARYERSIAGGSGDRYDELYLGWNYYLYGHELKLQSGIQYLEMRDRAGDGGAYSGWSWTTALRASW